jgi:hypothetical protein
MPETVPCVPRGPREIVAGTENAISPQFRGA